MADNSAKSGGVGLGMVLFLIFLVLKLTDTIDWSWWWVTAPLWIPIGLVVIILAIVGLVAVIASRKR
jgi:ABC-type antimicrobial peptide transport system permease subunit